MSARFTVSMLRVSENCSVTVSRLKSSCRKLASSGEVVSGTKLFGLRANSAVTSITGSPIISSTRSSVNERKQSLASVQNGNRFSSLRFTKLKEILNMLLLSVLLKPFDRVRLCSELLLELNNVIFVASNVVSLTVSSNEKRSTPRSRSIVKFTN